MASDIVSQTQKLGEVTLDTSVSFVQTIYNNPYVSGFISLIFALALSFGLIIFSKIISIFLRNRISKSFTMKDGVAPKKMAILVGDIFFYAMSFLSIYIAFTIAGIDIKLLMSGITIGVGFAFRQTLSNMISGIMIFSTSEYKIGNIVQLKMDGDVFGIVEEINMKNVLIRTFDMRRVIIPNSTFLKKAVKTYSAEEFLRIEAEVVVDVNLNIPLVIEETIRIVNEFTFVLNKQYTQVLLESFDDKKAKLAVQMFFNPNSGLSSEYIKSLVQIKLLELYKRFDKEAKSLVSSAKDMPVIKQNPISDIVNPHISLS